MLHRLTETDRRLALDERRFVQGGINLDEVEVSLEEGGAFSECDTVLLTMERDGMAPVPVRLDTMRVAVPASLMDVPGTLRFSLTGYVGDEVRATTERMRADKCGRVVPSGIIGGGPAPQDAAPDLWKQLMDEVDAATAGAEETLEKAEGAAKRAEGAASDAAAASSSAAGSESKASAAASAASNSAAAAASSAESAADSATGAGNAKTAAETAQKGAESAKTAAETAKAAAEKAKTDAETASTAASNSASQAATSAESAADSATGAGNAKTAAETAQKAAEAAKTAAETAQSAAADSASNAQQSATAAADSASSVADKFITSARGTTLEPGSQATASVEEQVLHIGVPKGDKGDKGDPGDPGHTPQRGVDYWTAEDVEAIVEDAKTQAVAELAEIGNVPKKTVTDLVAHGEDAYAQKPIEVRVKGKTWVNRWPNTTGTMNGLTVSVDDTGLFTVTGTATGNAYFGFDKEVPYIVPGKSYTGIVSNAVTGIQCRVQYRVGDSDSDTSAPAFSATGTTFQVPAGVTNIHCIMAIENLSGQTVNASFRVMLVDGTEAPDCFTPTASITNVETGKLVTSGKNLADIDDIADRTIENWCYDVDHPSCPMLPPGTYTLSADIESTLEPFGIDISSGDVSPNMFIGSSTDVNNSGRVSYSFTLDANDMQYKKLFFRFCRYESQQTYTYSAKNIQLELGSTATPYEPPTVTETPLPEVELRSLPNGTCDELVIKADGTCEVERNTGYIASYTDEEVTGEYVSTGNGLEAGSSIVYELDEPTTEPQTPVTLPALPAPTFNQYHDSPVPSDTSTEYVRDINIVLDNLAKQVAGTASAVAVREASTIEEE